MRVWMVSLPPDCAENKTVALDFLSALLDIAGVFITERLAGMAAVAVIGIKRHGTAVNYFINLTGTGIRAFAATSAFLAVYCYLPHGISLPAGPI